MRILRCGREAALIEVDGLPEVLGLHANLREHPPKGTLELVPASRTLLVAFDSTKVSFEQLSAELRTREVTKTLLHNDNEVVIPVSYDGEDLEDVVELTGLAVDDVIDRHLANTYTVAFCGFAPGFGYLDGLDPMLHVPRRETPRVRVPAGSVALAGDFTAVYPRQSPGGWQLIGHTDLQLWDVDRYPPTILTPGTTVRFERA